MLDLVTTHVVFRQKKPYPTVSVAEERVIHESCDGNCTFWVCNSSSITSLHSIFRDDDVNLKLNNKEQLRFEKHGELMKKRINHISESYHRCEKMNKLKMTNTSLVSDDRPSVN